MKTIAEKENCRLLVCDSGLGGLAIAADLYERLKKGRHFHRTEIIFFNCRPSNSLGYNHIKTDEGRCRVFSNALQAAEKYFKPDLIIIACNTLTVLYHKTDFSRKTTIPVSGIVNDGVELIENYFNEKNDTELILLGTKTTVNSGMHKKMLIKKGIPEEKIIYHECTELVAAIEAGALSENTQDLINKHLAEALLKSGNYGKSTALALLCTHFGYSRELFLYGAEKSGINLDCILDPNTYMVDNFMADIPPSSFEDSKIQIEVVTQAEHMPWVKNSIASLISQKSRDTEYALLNDTFIFNFFNIEQEN